MLTVVFTLDGAEGDVAPAAARVIERWNGSGLPPDVEPAFEVRLDGAIAPAAAVEWIETSPWPVIATMRRREDGGRFAGEEAERLAWLVAAARGGARWVDVEWMRARDLALPPGVGRLVSHHAWDEPPSRLAAVEEGLRSVRADLVKLVSRPRSARDLLHVLESHRRLGRPGAVFGLGELGSITRWISCLEHHGRHDLLYVAAGWHPLAPGQPTADDFFRDGARLLAATPGEGGFLALLGLPTDHSLSPIGFNAALARAGRPCMYVTLPLPRLDGFRELLAPARVLGLSVTAPHKVDVRDHLDRLEPGAASAGAVNTVRAPPRGPRVGENFDRRGVVEAVRPVLAAPQGGRALVLGAGGAARAAVAAVRELGLAPVVAARRARAAVTLAAELRADTLSWGEAVRGEGGPWALMVNATPVGGPSERGRSPVSDEACGRAAVVLDMVYRPVRTPLLAAAARAGARTVSGLEMLIAQAHAQWRWLVGADAAAEAALEAAVRLGAVEEDVVLVGARGAGKSTVGREIAHRMRRPFLDTDDLVERRAGDSIDDIFRKHGEDGFRIRETRVVADLGDAGGRVIATGGGAPLRPANREHLRHNGFIVFLDVDAETAWSRINEDDRPRPALTSQPAFAELASIIHRRRPVYEKLADVRVDARQPVADVAEATLSLLAQRSFRGSAS